MDKTAIKNFSVWARKALIRSVADKCGLVGVREDGIQEPLPQSTRDMQFFDAGTGAPASISGDEIKKREALVQAIREKERDSDYKTAYSFIVEQVAYTWFNRLIAIRFMEVNDYLPSRIRVLSSEQAGKLEPDILATPFDAEFDFTAQERDAVIQWKDRGQKEDMDALFRLLFVKQCDALHEILPNLFQKVDGHDYTELLLNIAFTDRDGVVYHLVNDIPESNFDISQEGQVEIIGWMYQYYNTELKDDTFAQLKKNVKISKERIPAATQLFTPDWIVRYMVENSLGRLWVEGHPNDGLKENWRYYLEEAEQKEEEVQAQLAEIRREYAALNPEDIKLIDPCMGSGHILVYAFDVLMQIYESQGYTLRDAAQSILANNLFGLDIDERAAQLAYFAVMMKARQYDRRILTRGIQPHVLAIQESNGIRRAHLDYFGAGMSELEKNTARMQLENLLETLRDAREYGSILRVESCDWELLRRFVVGIDVVSQITLDSIGVEDTAEKLMRLIDVGQALAQKYDVVVTNPPYMGASGMNPRLAQYVKDQYPDTKSDLFACFIERGNQMARLHGYNCMVTMQSWMFLSSFEKMRENILRSKTITNLMHMENMVMGIAFGTAVTVFFNGSVSGYKGTYNHIKQADIENEQPKEFPVQGNRFAQVSSSNFSKIPGSPVAYWVSAAFIKALNAPKLKNIARARSGAKTGKNELFIRIWSEVSWDNIKLDCFSFEECIESGVKWFPYNKGGDARNWYGNRDLVVDFQYGGENIRAYSQLNETSIDLNATDVYFKQGITWTALTSAKNTFRYSPAGCAFDSNKGPMVFAEDKSILHYLLGFFVSEVAQFYLKVFNPSLSLQNGDMDNLSIIIDPQKEDRVVCMVEENVEKAKTDWDSYETSWDFKKHPLV